MNIFTKWFHRLGSPPWFYRVSGKLIPWMSLLCAALIIYGLYGGLVVAPPDYQQGDSFRIIYIHVPAALLSMFIYVVMAVAGGISLIWRMKMADVVLISSAPIGAVFTVIALATGSLWGKPMWGTWWTWDARLTSELLLLFLYLGIIALHNAVEDRQSAARAVSVLALVGVVNIPIIHYSVVWWNTLHQGATIMRLDGPAIDESMRWPLFAMIAAFYLYYFIVLMLRARGEVLNRESRSRWVRELVAGD
ncbi:MAG: heme ABC transporter permease [Chromatiales bacterium]|mgnify:FL=1|jgi:heme exporter protein C